MIGAGRSGIGAARVLTRLGANVTLSDSQPEPKFTEEQKDALKATGAQVVLGATPEKALPVGTTLVVTSPGVPKYAPVLQEAVRRGLPIWSEIELAYRITNAPIVAVTGTNGKTTTTLLIAAMLREAGKNVTVAGNISADEIKQTLVEAAFSISLPHPPAPSPSGTCFAGGEGEALAISPFPLSTARNERPRERGLGGEGETILVAEISSFQLEWVEQFAPRVGVLTNITPDHLNRHASFEEYAQTKARLFAAQSNNDYAIINADNPASNAIGKRINEERCCWFTRQEGQEIYPFRIEARPDGHLVLIRDGLAHVLLHRDDMPFTLPGTHSIENVLAASASAYLMGAKPDAIAKAVREFPGVAHRMEIVAEVNGVRYINNSMCTNIEAAIHSLRAMTVPTIVIAGGADKELDFAPLTTALHEKAQQLILIGSAADKMEGTFRANGYNRITREKSLEMAVTRASTIARPGEAVLLSPACASFDMFRDFEARGAAFRQAVHALAADASQEAIQEVSL